jgi:hypothetical protein
MEQPLPSRAAHRLRRLPVQQRRHAGAPSRCTYPQKCFHALKGRKQGHVFFHLFTVAEQASGEFVAVERWSNG